MNHVLDSVSFKERGHQITLLTRTTLQGVSNGSAASQGADSSSEQWKNLLYQLGAIACNSTDAGC